MNEKFYPGYENTEAINRELKRLVDSATARPIAQTPATRPHARRNTGRLISCVFLFLVLTGAPIFWSQLRQPETANSQNRWQSYVTPDGAVRLLPKQLRNITVESVIREGVTAGREALTVPESALIVEDSKPMVFVEEAPGQFRRRRVEPGARFGDYVIIEGGLQEGDRVVTHGAILLTAISHK